MKEKTKKGWTRILTALLVAVVVIGFTPQMGMTAYAEDGTPAIQLVTDGATSNIQGAQASSVWFANGNEVTEKTVKSGSDGLWTFSFEGMPIRDTQGKPISNSITVDEVISMDGLYVYQTETDKMGAYTFSILNMLAKKPELIITAKDQTYTYNGQIQGEGDTVYDDPAQISEKVTVSGLQDGDELTSIIIDGQGQDVGSYDLVPSGAAVNGAPASDKYNVEYANGKLTIDPITYTVTFVDGQGKTLKTEEVKSGEAATAPADPKRTGYTFKGWDKDFSKVTGDITVTAQWEKNEEPEPTPEPTPKPRVSGTLLAKMTSKGRRSLVISWSKVKGAEGYDIFFSQCSTDERASKCKKMKTFKGNKTFKWTKKKLKTKFPYKAVVKAYITKDGRKTYVRISPMVHAFTSGGTDGCTNVKSITVKKSKVSLTVGKTSKIRASIKKLQKGKKLMSSGHAPRLRYVSGNNKIATVSKSGKITAKAKGSCKVYVIAVNGIRKTVAVTVR